MIISTPSYVIPGTYLENVRVISKDNRIGSVELLFFIYDGDTENLFLKEREDIRRFRKQLRFTVHMPDNLTSRHEGLIEATGDIAASYVLHPPEGDPVSFAEMVKGWVSRYGKRFLLENLIERDFSETLELCGDAIDICCDCGHLLIRGERPLSFLQHYGSRVREIHLHGVKDGWDHKPFSANERWFQEIVPFLSSFSGICNIELFALEEVKKVLDVLSETKLAGSPW